MDFTADTVDSLVAEYETTHPFATVEDEHLEMLPPTLTAGDYGWRDLEWVVQWYYRRTLGAVPNAERREREAAFAQNEYEAVHAAIDDALAADGTTAKLESLTALSGVDVPVASAFVQFLSPEHFLAVGEREWRVLADREELSQPYPDEPGAVDYVTYLECCRTVADRCSCDLQTLYRALWMLGYEQPDA